MAIESEGTSCKKSNKRLRVNSKFKIQNSKFASLCCYAPCCANAHHATQTKFKIDEAPKKKSETSYIKGFSPKYMMLEFLKSNPTGGNGYPRQMEQTSKTLFPSAFCPLPSLRQRLCRTSLFLNRLGFRFIESKI
ncbi:MAG: hypothetical protein F6K21_39175 [Symploca sp. SIO2D2]|nr:hypothetical protein [Symploca sp. SIO2D2]